jgi:hypothetical protein
MSDIDGNVICTYIMPGSGYEQPNSICETNNAGFVVAGSADAGTNAQALLVRTLGADPLVGDVADIAGDQGRQVRVSWNRSWYDEDPTSNPITSYSIWRKIGTSLLASGVPHVDGGRVDGRLSYPPGDWDYVTTVPARGEFEYNCVVPTLCDSTSQGQCMSYFFVSAETASPLVYFDSPVDSGYSVDNLAPGPPEGLHMESEVDLAWEEASEADFDYFSVYGSDDGDFGNAVLIGYTIDVEMDISGDIYAYYHVTATDFAGNEGQPATALNTYASVPGEVMPTVYALRQNRPNPFGAETAISFDMLHDGQVQIDVLDVGGGVVCTLLKDVSPAGSNTVTWDGRDAAGRQASPGIYFVRMQAGEFTSVRKMTLLE